jgi:hypothetical protein
MIPQLQSEVLSPNAIADKLKTDHIRISTMDRNGNNERYGKARKHASAVNTSKWW